MSPLQTVSFCHRKSVTDSLCLSYRFLSVADNLYFSQTVRVCQRHCVESKFLSKTVPVYHHDMRFLSKKVYVNIRKYVTVTHIFFLSQTVCVCQRYSFSVTPSLCLSYTVCFCPRQSLSLTASLCLSQTHFLIVLGLHLDLFVSFEFVCHRILWTPAGLETHHIAKCKTILWRHKLSVSVSSVIHLRLKQNRLTENFLWPGSDFGNKSEYR